MITSALDLAAATLSGRKRGMVTPNPHVHGIRPSSVVPKHVSGGSTHELTGLDLAMRLHYIKAVYFFNKDQLDGITIYDLKEAMFLLLDSYFPVAGRIRCPDTEEDSAGKQLQADHDDNHDHQKRRYYIKCNDGGVRIIEAKCDKTVKEWIEMDEEADIVSNDEGLVPNVIIGPKVDFIPLMLLQLTTFSCGGLAIGLSCNHVLGDVFTISIFMNTYSDLLAGNSPKLPAPNQWKPKKHYDDLPRRAPCTYLKPASTIEDAWLIDAGKPMKQFRLHISETSLANLKSKVGKRFSPFGLISAVVWKAAAEVRGSRERVTVVRKCCGTDDGRWILGNRHQIASSVALLGDVASADLSELARVITEVKADEDSREDIARMMEMDGFPDVMMYGGDLTFVDLDGVKCGDFKMNQRGPQFVNLFYTSVGGEGVVTVSPGPEHDSKGGRVVCVCMCVDEIDAVRRVVMEELSMCA